MKKINGREYTKLYCELNWGQTVDETLLELENQLHGDSNRTVREIAQAIEAQRKVRVD